MSEINPTDHKSIIDHHFPDEGFRGAVRNWLNQEETISRLWLTFRSGEIMDGASAIIVCIILGA